MVNFWAHYKIVWLVDWLIEIKKYKNAKRAIIILHYTELSNITSLCMLVLMLYFDRNPVNTDFPFVTPWPLPSSYSLSISLPDFSWGTPYFQSNLLSSRVINLPAITLTGGSVTRRTLPHPELGLLYRKSTPPLEKYVPYIPYSTHKMFCYGSLRV